MKDRYQRLISQENIKKFWPASKENWSVCLPQSIIYHYTSANALCSIMQNQSFWLTKSNFMNDISEIEYACDLFLERLNMSNINHYSRAKIKNSFENRIKSGLFDNLYVLCFSSNPDSLPLWSYYGKNDGYNLGIDPSFIYDFANAEFIYAKTLDTDKSTFKQSKQKLCVKINSEDKVSYGMQITANYVLYSKQEQISIFDTILREMEYLVDLDDLDSSMHLKLCLSLLIDFIPFMKHSKYKNEEEYRIIIKVEARKNEMNKIQKYRVFNGALVPYVSTKLNKHEYFKSIGISPFNNNEFSRMGIETLKETFPSPLEIKVSEIPSRF